MLYKYCPNCYSLNIKFDYAKNIHICLSCNHQGEIKRDSIDKINSYRKQKLAKENSDDTYQTTNKKETNNKDTQESIQNKVKKKFNTTKNDDWELL